MEATSSKKYLRISRRKIARVGKECIGKQIKQVKAQLGFLPNESARELFKLLKSAESNFLVQNPNFNPDELFVLDISVNKGPSFKRIIYRAKGRANRIEKKTSHVKVVLGDKLVEKKAGKKNDKKSEAGNASGKAPSKGEAKEAAKEVAKGAVKEEAKKVSEKRVEKKALESEGTASKKEAKVGNAGEK